MQAPMVVPSESSKVMCPRCRRWVLADRPWPHWRKLRALYFAVIGVALLGGPVILADAFVLIPTLMVYLVAIGPLNHLARQQPACRRCGGPLELPSPRRFARLLALFRPSRQ